MTEKEADEIVMKNAVCCSLFTYIREGCPKRTGCWNPMPQPMDAMLMCNKKGKHVIGLSERTLSGYTNLGFYESTGVSHVFTLENIQPWILMLDKHFSLLYGNVMYMNYETSDVLKFRAHLLDIMIENSKHGVCWRKTRLPMPFDPHELFIAWDLGTFSNDPHGFNLHMPSVNAMKHKLMLAA